MVGDDSVSIKILPIKKLIKVYVFSRKRIRPFTKPFAAHTHSLCVPASGELLDPYFDKKGIDFDGQDEVVWSHRVALTAFALPFSLAIAVPLVGPMFVAVAQGAVAELVWTVLEPSASDAEGDDGGVIHTKYW